VRGPSILSRLSSRLLLLCTVVACAPVSAQPARPRLLSPDLAALEVTNKNWEDLLVYISKGESEMRLGIVPGLSTRTLFVPASFIASGTGFQLVAGPRSAPRRYISQPFDASPGRSIYWIVDYHITTSSVTVR
jgi:hypothetical protein